MRATPLANDTLTTWISSTRAVALMPAIGRPAPITSPNTRLPSPAAPFIAILPSSALVSEKLVPNPVLEPSTIMHALLPEAVQVGKIHTKSFGLEPPSVAVMSQLPPAVSHTMSPAWIFKMAPGAGLGPGCVPVNTIPVVPEVHVSVPPT